ncbi:hypothetical protein ACN27F_24745 [Solwaraspora sp. WMMB335]
MSGRFAQADGHIGVGGATVVTHRSFDAGVTLQRYAVRATSAAV